MAGGSIRAAAKAAVIGGYRSAAYMRRAVTPSSHTSSADGRKASTFAMDDWVITDREVFGPVPTHEEAMAATLDLKDAFEIAKVESHIALLELVHSETPQDFVHSEASKKEDDNENFIVSSGTAGRVVQAFTLLHESPEAQDVVASLASDKNVWDAVMNNEKVMKFYKTYESKLSECSSVASSVSGDEAEDGEAASQQSNTYLSQSAGESVKDYLEKMKALVSEMMANLSNMMQDLVATSDEGRSKGKIKTLVRNMLDDMLEKNLEIVKAPCLNLVEPTETGGGIRLFKKAPPGISMDSMDKLHVQLKRPRIVPGEEVDEKSKKFRHMLQSVVVDGSDIVVSAKKASERSLARLEAREAAAKAKAKREEERVQELKKVRGEKWLPSVARQMKEEKAWELRRQ